MGCSSGVTITKFMSPSEQFTDVAKAKRLTGPHVYAEGALGDPHPSEGDANCVRSGLGGPVGAAVHAVALILHHYLHTVLAAVGVSDHDRHVSRTGSYGGNFIQRLGLDPDRLTHVRMPPVYMLT